MVVVVVVVVGGCVVVVVVVGGVPPNTREAAATSMRPRPNTLSGPVAPMSAAVSSNADSEADTEPGMLLNNSAIAPDTAGAAIDVPLQ